MINTFKGILWFFICLSLIRVSGQDIHPFLKIKTSGAITDFLIHHSQIIASTDAGTIETYDLISGMQEDLIQLPKTEDFMGDAIATKVFSVDILSTDILSVSLGKDGFRDVFIFSEGQKKQVISSGDNRMMIKKARWINHNTILLGLMSNDLVLFDIEKKQPICEMNICPYTFSDLSLTADKQYVFTADESGIVHKIKTGTCELVEEYSGINVDNIYQLVYKEGIVITAGQDRRVGIYHTVTGMDYYLQNDFLVYSVGLSPDGSIGAYTASEDNDITLFQTENKDVVHVLKGHRSVVTKIEFIDNQTLVTTADDHYIIIWKIN